MDQLTYDHCFLLTIALKGWSSTVTYINCFGNQNGYIQKFSCFQNFKTKVFWLPINIYRFFIDHTDKFHSSELSHFILRAAAAKSLQSCLTLHDPIDGSPPGSPIRGILQARILEWVAISFSNAWKWKVKSESEVAQSCLTLSDPMDCSPPGSSVHGIF